VSRAGVRLAIANYLAEGSIAGNGYIQYLSTVFPHPPKLTNQGDFVNGEDPGLGSGAVIYIHLRESSQRRIAIGPAATPENPKTPARKEKVHEVGLICLLRSQKNTTQAAGEDNDAFLDTLESWVLQNRTANSNGAIFQWGEGDGFGTHDIHVRAGMPRALKNGASQVFSTVDITVVEILDT